jgi:hypothetical protein
MPNDPASPIALLELMKSSGNRRLLSFAVLIYCVVIGSSAFQLSYAQTSVPSVANGPLPAFSSNLARVGLPEGQFHGWCGNDDVFLMRVGREFRLYTWDSRSGATIPTKPRAGPYDLKCDEKAENAVYSDDLRDKIDIYRFNIKTQTTTLVASAGKKKSYPLPVISISPSALHVAYRPDTVDLGKLAVAPELRLIQVNGEGIRWKSDSSMLFSIVASPVTALSNRNNYSQEIEIAHTKTEKRISGKLPRGYRLHNGVFVNGGNELLLFLKFFDDDFGNEDGVIFKCSLSAFNCRPSLSKVRQVSINEKADIAVTKWIFNEPPPRPDGVATVLPDRYVVEVIKRDSKVLSVAEFSPEAAYSVNVTISPTGESAAVTWFVPDSECRSDLSSQFCQMGALLDLKGGSR